VGSIDFPPVQCVRHTAA